ncbi:MAG: hypothetical protein HKL92_03300 [Candidatus Eremiobacteraeota bacterium]|nr:hypothetical protein [Candidatus Eremiobacteraeota bacterium]
MVRRLLTSPNEAPTVLVVALATPKRRAQEKHGSFYTYAIRNKRRHYSWLGSIEPTDESTL